MRIRECLGLLALSAFGALSSGCFTMQPVRNVAPTAGAAVSVDVNDAGRVALEPTMGREIDQIHGNLIRQDSADYIMAVTSVDFLHGGSQTWTGEVIPIKTAYVSAYYAQAFSPQRTLIVGAVVVAAAALMAKQGLSAGSAPVEEGTPPPPPPDVKQRAPRGLKIPLHPVSTIRVVHHLWSALGLRF